MLFSYKFDEFEKRPRFCLAALFIIQAILFFLKKQLQNKYSVDLLGCSNFFIEIFCFYPLQSQAYSLFYVYKSFVHAAPRRQKQRFHKSNFRF